MTSRRLETESGAVRRLLTAVVGFVLALLGLALTAVPAAAGNIVGAQPGVLILAFGPHDAAAPGGTGADALPQLRHASATGVAAETATTVEQVVARNGANLARVTGQDQAAIQSAATRIGKPISLVGSRSTGNISMASDYDYVVTEATKEDIAILRKALPSAYTGIGEPPGIDIFTSGLEPGMPYITFNP